MIPAWGDALLAEHLVAAHLSRLGCALARDVPVPSGSSADFAVARDGERFHAHVKWLSHVEPRGGRTIDRRGGDAVDANDSGGRLRLGPIPRVLRELERIDRPVEVAIRWRAGAGCARFRRMVKEVAPFLRSARISEERVAHDTRGMEIGRVRVVAPLDAGSRLRLIDERRMARRILQAARAQRLLRKALAQFAPRSTNVIVVVGSDPEQAHAMDLALRGSVVEDWSRFPRRGERVAHGRADDGFWSGGRASASTAVAWMLPGPSMRPARRVLWIRDGARLAPAVRQLLAELFDDGRGLQ